MLAEFLWVYLPPLLILAAALGIGWVVHRFSRFYQEEVAEISHTRVQTLDGLRGFLATGVAIHHYTMNYAYLTDGDSSVVAPFHRSLGSFSVTLFFAITGYLFWGKAVAGKVRVWPHFRSRLFRIAPLYWFAAVITLMIAVGIAGVPKAEYAAESLKGVGRLLALGIVPVGGATPPLDARYNGTSLYHINSVIWTLEYEWLFYSALPVLALFRKPVLLGLLLGVYAALAVLRVPYFPRSPFYAAFVVGMVTVYLVQSPRLCAVCRRPAMGWVVLAALAVVPTMAMRASLFYTFVLTGIALVVFVIIAGGNALFGLLASPAAKTLGAASYSIYLLHMLVLTPGQGLLERVAVGGSAGRPPVAYWLVSAGGVLLAVGIAFLTYRRIEAPFIRWERSMRKRRDVHPVKPPGLRVVE